MNPHFNGGRNQLITATDLARQQYYEELLENSRKKLTQLRSRARASTEPRITMDILLEETIASNAERELDRLKKQNAIL